MESPERERQFIVDYIAEIASDETVEQLEKVYSERIMGQDHDIWDVHTNADRWWVITGPTNLYSQKQFPSMDVALTFHVGLMMRVRNQSELEAPEEQADFFPVAWRKWAQAAETFNEADEVEQFQAVGMMSRESLIAFVKEAAEIIPLAEDVSKPKANDFLGWIDVIGNTIAGGESAERRRGYLKAIAKSTWELVQWLTHAGNAIRFDAYFAFKATGHVLSVFSLALMRFQSGVPDRCPACASYRLSEDYRRDDNNEALLFAICEACGWEDDPIILDEIEETDKVEQAINEPKEVIGDCVFVEVPLRGRKPPKPSRQRIK
jgi:hypothetical protein